MLTFNVDTPQCKKMKNNAESSNVPNQTKEHPKPTSIEVLSLSRISSPKLCVATDLNKGKLWILLKGYNILTLRYYGGLMSNN